MLYSLNSCPILTALHDEVFRLHSVCINIGISSTVTVRIHGLLPLRSRSTRFSYCYVQT